jgi:molecular chaperone HscB
MNSPVTDPFTTLGIPHAYDVDLRAVEKIHRDLSRALHPDRHARGGASERREALRRAVEVNDAWRIVRDPVRRAEALLALRPLARGAREAPLESEFLMEVLERREALAEARVARDRARVDSLAQDVRASVAEAERELARGLAGEADAGLPSVVGKLRFYLRFLDEVSAIEDERV